MTKTGRRRWRPKKSTDETGNPRRSRRNEVGGRGQLPSSHQVAVAHWRVMMSFVRVLSNSSSKAAGCACVRPHSAEGRRGFRFLPCLFFRAAIASGLVTVILRTFSAPLPKRVVLNAFARRMRLWDLSHSLEPGDMYTTIYVYDFPSRSSKLSSRSLRVGNKELLHTTQFQTALYTASGER